MTTTDATARLFAAIREGRTQDVRALLEADRQLAAARNADGLSAVTWACYCQRPEPLAELLAAGPTLDAFEAAAAGHEERVLALLAADPELVRARSADGFGVLHLAAFFGHESLAGRLLERGADPAAPADNASRVTPLHSAAAARAAGIVRRLLAAGAPPDARQAGGYTALMAAAQQGDAALVERLLAHGADAGLRTDDGRSAADLADERAHHALAARLRGFGGN